MISRFVAVASFAAYAGCASPGLVAPVPVAVASAPTAVTSVESVPPPAERAECTMKVATPVAFDVASNGAFVAVATHEGDNVPGTVDVWDVATGMLVRSLDPGVGRVGTVAFSPDGRFLATAVDVHTSEGTVRLFDPATGKVVAEAGTYCFQQLEWSPDSSWVAASGCHMSLVVLKTTGKVWERTPQQSTYDGAAAQGTPISASADGKRLHFLVQDGRIESWNVTAGEGKLAAKSAVASWSASAFTHDGSRFAVAGESGIVEVWNTAPLKRVSRFKLATAPLVIDRLQIAGDGLVVGWSSGRVALVSSSGHVVVELSSSTPPPPPFSPPLIAADDRSATVAVSDARFGLSLFDAKTGKKAVLRPAGLANAEPSVSFVLGRNGSLLIDGSSNGSAVVWDVARREKAFSWSPGGDARSTTLAAGALVRVDEDRVLLGRTDGSPPVSLVSLLDGPPIADKATRRVGLAFREGAYSGASEALACVPGDTPKPRATLLAEVFAR